MRRRDDNPNRQKWIVIFIAFIMVFSVVGFIFGREGDQGDFEYNGHSFKRGDRWSVVLDKKELFFDYLPSEVDSINVSSDIIGKVKNGLEVDTTYDENSSYVKQISYAQYELNNVLSSNFGIYFRNGFTENNSYGLPIITCENSTNALPVVYFRESDITQIYADKNCIIAEGKDGFDFVRIKDRILYGVFGIIR